jgi:hypothetical protein
MARQRREARTAYSVTCPAFLVAKSTVSLRTKGRLERLEATKITPIQSSTGSQYLK